jgi:phosphoribosylaminoimidazole-succinocarboxamide synthase
MTSSHDTLFKSDIKSLQLINSGKVRDIYAVDKQHMLIVTSDRISAFDVVMPDPIPGKGKVLTAVSNFWFERFKNLLPSHLSNLTLEQVLPDAQERQPIVGRGIVVKRGSKRYIRQRWLNPIGDGGMRMIT